ncbi:hypothetical protein GYB22_11450 [bacterium]|nr:hypothetical protein [bacterium]
MSQTFDKKLSQLRLQHKIFSLLFEDNGVSSHFDYHVNIMSDDETIKLNLLTYNKRHDEYMLFHTVKGSSSLNCLEKMLEYIKEHQNSTRQNSYTIKWSKKNEPGEYKSYFIAKSEDDAILKFLHEKNEEDYEFTCTLNPVS